MLGFIECKVNCPSAAKQNHLMYSYKCATPTDFTVGAKVECPSGMGGLFTTTVKSIENNIATCVKPYCKDHGKLEYKVHLLPPAMTIDQVRELQELTKRISGLGCHPTNAEYNLLVLGRINGLIAAYNAWSWTELGREVLDYLKQAQVAE